MQQFFKSHTIIILQPEGNDKCLAFPVGVCYTEFNIILYTGYTYEELQEMSTKVSNIEVLQRFLDFIIDGRYEDSLRDLTLKFRGSSNQRVIDVKSSLNQNKIVTVNR